MPYYDIEVYEVHAQVFRVKGDDPGDAIVRQMDGAGTASDNGPEYIELGDHMGQHARLLAEEAGVPVAELLARLNVAGIELDDVLSGDPRVPTIRSIGLSDNQENDQD